MENKRFVSQKYKNIHFSIIPSTLKTISLSPNGMKMRQAQCLFFNLKKNEIFNEKMNFLEIRFIRNRISF